MFRLIHIPDRLSYERPLPLFCHPASTLAVIASAPCFLKFEKNINTFKNFVLIGMKTNPCISMYAAVINLISFMYSFLDLKKIYILILYIYNNNYSCVSSLSSEIASCIDSLAISSTKKSGLFHSIGYHFLAYRWYVDSS